MTGSSVSVGAVSAGAVLLLLLENMGRINFSHGVGQARINVVFCRMVSVIRVKEEGENVTSPSNRVRTCRTLR